MRYLTAMILNNAATISHEVSQTGLSKAKKNLIQSECDWLAHCITDMVEADDNNNHDDIILTCNELLNGMQWIQSNTTKKQAKSTTYKSFYKFVEAKMQQASERAVA